MSAIELDSLTKRFGNLVAVQNMDLTVDEGEIFGFLGPNGAGKSTTINILLDFVRPTGGSARIFDLDCQEEDEEIRDRIGVLPEGYEVYDRLTGEEHLDFAVESKDADQDVYELLDRVGLVDAAGRKAGGYSKGMQQRLVLAMALVGEPDLLILDEPTTGLDPNGARKLREIVEEENERGTTVFFSSHILGQVESVCDRVGILRDGELVADDSIEGLRSNVSGGEMLIVEGSRFSNEVISAVEGMHGVGGVTERAPGQVLAINVTDDINKTDILSEIEDQGGTVADFSTQQAGLEELFAAYTTDQGVEV